MCLTFTGATSYELDMDLWERISLELQRKGILYAPDYLINAGGIINLSAEIGSPYNAERAREKTERIYELMGRVIQVSKQEEISTARAADRIAEERLASVQAIKTFYRPR